MDVKHIVDHFIVCRWDDFSGPNSESYWPLLCASQWGHVEVVRLLIEMGADVNVVSGEGKSALSTACEREQIEVVKCLLEQGADPYHGRPLQMACRRGFEEVVRVLLDSGSVDVNHTGDGYDGLTPLHEAMFGPPGSSTVARIIRMLLDAGADVNHPQSIVLSEAVKWQDKGIVQMLLDAGADISSPGIFEHMLKTASERGDDEIVRILLNAGTDASQGHVLHEAAYAGHQ
jgi:ankyrin repeat protein